MKYFNSTKIEASDMVSIQQAGLAHTALMQPALETVGARAVSNWVVKLLSLYDFGLPNDINQRASRIDTWVEEVGKYPVWALAKAAGWLKARDKAPTIKDAIDDLELASGHYRRRRDALIKAYNIAKGL